MARGLCGRATITILLIFVLLRTPIIAIAHAASPSGAQTTGTPDAPPDELTLVPLDVRLVDAGDGWQDLTVDFGVRNDGVSPHVVYFPGFGEGTIAIPEGYTYEAGISGIPFNYENDALYGFALPPGFTLCGVVGPSAPIALQAQGRIPAETVPASLNVAGFPSVDLTRPPSREVCTPQTSQLPPLDDEVVIGSEGGPAHVSLRFGVGGDRMRIEFRNLNRFGEMNAGDVRLYFLYENGVWGRPRVGDPFDNDASCQVGNPIRLLAGPSQSGDVELCLPAANRAPVALLLTSETLGTATALRIGQGTAASPGTAAQGSTPEATTDEERATGLDMPVYRGDAARTGVQPGPVPTSAPQLLWQFRTDGPVSSAPVLADGVAYVGSADGFLYALDAATGEELWRFQAGGALTTPPTVVEGVVYVGGDALYAVDAESGTQVWGRQLATCASSPIVVDGVLYVGADALYAIDATTGEDLWTTDIENCPSTPALAGGVIYLRTWGELQAAAYDAASGMKLWQANSFDSDPAAPAVADGTVFVGDDAGYVRAFAASDGQELWSVRPEVETSEGLSYYGSKMTAPAAASGTIYIGSDAGLLLALDAATGEERWHFATSGREAGGTSVQSAPSVVDGVVVVGDDDGFVHAFDGESGAELWQLKTGGPVRSSPTIVGGVVYVGSDDGTVSAIAGQSEPAIASAEQAEVSTPDEASVGASNEPEPSGPQALPAVFSASLTRGSCDNPGPLGVLADLEIESDGTAVQVAVSSVAVPIALSELDDGEHAIIVADQKDASRSIACGEIVGTPDEQGNLFVPLRQRDESGASGIAWLGLGADDTTITTLYLAASAIRTSSGAGGIPDSADPFPALVHERSCQEDGNLLYGLAELAPNIPVGQTTAGSVRVSTTQLNVDLSNLGGNSVAVYEDTGDAFNLVACATVEGSPDEQGNLFLGLREENLSGVFGIAWLLDGGNGATTVTVFLA